MSDWDDDERNHEFDPPTSASVNWDPHQIHELDANVCISSFPAALTGDVLRRNIGDVVNVSCENYTQRNRDVFKGCGITCFWFCTVERSSTNIIKRGLQVLKRIRANQERGVKTLVHCHMGINRSTSCLMIYCFHEYGDSYDEALQRIRVVRPFVDPSLCGFDQQLRQYADDLAMNRMLGDCSMFV